MPKPTQVCSTQPSGAGWTWSTSTLALRKGSTVPAHTLVLQEGDPVDPILVSPARGTEHWHLL